MLLREALKASEELIRGAGGHGVTRIYIVVLGDFGGIFGVSKGFGGLMGLGVFSDCVV